MVPDDTQAGLSQSAKPAERHDISWLLGRRSVAVKRLGPPSPSDDELRLILSAALAAPDHGALRPWRIVVCTPESRERLAELFVEAKHRLNPQATDLELTREREKALRPPVLLALVAAPKPGIAAIPEIEQIASAGAALQSILLAAHGLGYGAIMLSGSRCAAENVRAAFGLVAHETILGFISIGTVVDTPRLASRPTLSDVLTVYTGS
jgi:nitroreductase